MFFFTKNLKQQIIITNNNNKIVLGSCDTDLPIDVILTSDQDCLPEEPDDNECSALHGFIQNIARAFGDGATNVRFAILLHESSGESQTLFDFYILGSK